MDYQKLYDLKKAENLLKKHGLMDTNLKKKIDDEAKKENAKKEKEKKSCHGLKSHQEYLQKRLRRTRSE